MLNKRHKFHKFNEGVVKIYRDNTTNSSFGAKKNSTKLSDMEYLGKLDYYQQTCRQEDLEYCEQLGFSLSLKIKTHLKKDVKIKHKAVINNTLYTINFINHSKKAMYLYLERVRELETEQQTTNTSVESNN